MLECEIPKGDMLPNPVYVLLDKTGLDFKRAQDAARNLAKKIYWEPMLLSWFDKKAGKYSPKDVTCCTEEKTGWVDNAAGIPNDEKYFVDRVHFSKRGAARMAKNFLPVVRELMNYPAASNGVSIENFKTPQGAGN